MDSEGETALIPSEIMHYSIHQSNSNKVDINTTLALLASPSRNLADIPGADQAADHVVRLVAAVLRFCEVESKVVEAKVFHLLSPQVSSTTLWFLRQWALSYLLPTETYYSEISMPLVSAFGQHTDGAMWTMNYLLNKIESNLCLRNSEPVLVKESVNLLTSLVEVRDKGAVVLKCQGFWQIVNLQNKLERGVLPQAAKRGLMKAFILAGAALEDSQKRDEYWLQILKPLQERFKNIVCQENFNQIFQDDKTRNEVIDIFECFIAKLKQNDPHLEYIRKPDANKENYDTNLLSLHSQSYNAKESVKKNSRRDLLEEGETIEEFFYKHTNNIEKKKTAASSSLEMQNKKNRIIHLLEDIQPNIVILMEHGLEHELLLNTRIPGYVLKTDFSQTVYVSMEKEEWPFM
ncbi:Exportin-4 [Homalodisca vitripennis]|nr:Exportin-4 [Homalodisca vitripennis]